MEKVFLPFIPRPLQYKYYIQPLLVYTFPTWQILCSNSFIENIKDVLNMYKYRQTLAIIAIYSEKCLVCFILHYYSCTYTIMFAYYIAYKIRISIMVIIKVFLWTYMCVCMCVGEAQRNQLASACHIARFFTKVNFYLFNICFPYFFLFCFSVLY